MLKEKSVYKEDLPVNVIDGIGRRKNRLDGTALIIDFVSFFHHHAHDNAIPLVNALTGDISVQTRILGKHPYICRHHDVHKSEPHQLLFPGFVPDIGHYAGQIHPGLEIVAGIAALLHDECGNILHGGKGAYTAAVMSVAEAFFSLAWLILHEK